MPYIDKDMRDPINLWLEDSPWLFDTPTLGELNYIITQLLLGTLPKRYSDFNNLVGVLECVKLEMYRRMIVPYEDKKIEENGDVYYED